MASSDKPQPPSEEKKTPKKQESFYDAQFSIEAIQNEPYEGGFTWKTILGALFICFIMLPGVIFMGLMIGMEMGSAADWVTIILFVEIARRAFITLRKQELYILKYTASQLTNVAGGLAIGGGVFGFLVFARYMRNSEAFESFGIAHQVPDWVAPYGDAAYLPFWNEVWWPAIGVAFAGMVLTKITQLSLGYLAFKATADVEKLPFPLAPVHAEGAIALAETSQDKNKKGYRQYCFSTGVILGAAFGALYVAVPILTDALIGKQVAIFPLPFLDLTQSVSGIFPAASIAISFNLTFLFLGFVLPYRIVTGWVATAIVVNLLVNPMLYRLGFLPSWSPGKDAVETHVSNQVDMYISVGIGTALAVLVVGVWGIGKAVVKYNRQKKQERDEKVGAEEPELDVSKFFFRDVARGDPPTWIAIILWMVSAVGFVYLSDYLVNRGVPAEEQFPTWWLWGFAFFFTPLSTYINARMSGIAGQHAGIPMISEAAILTSGYNRVNIWFAPLPIHNFGQMADLFKETQLTRTKFTSIFRAELFIFPLMFVTSFIYWSYLTGQGPIPSDSFPYAEKFWPQFAQLRALWAASLQEGQSMLLEALKPAVIVTVLVALTALFGVFSVAGISAQYIYGGIAAMSAVPDRTIILLLGALLGRFYLSKLFGKTAWTNYAPILMVGFTAGMGLLGMLAIAVNFLWTAIS